MTSTRIKELKKYCDDSLSSEKIIHLPDTLANFLKFHNQDIIEFPPQSLLERLQNKEHFWLIKGVPSNNEQNWYLVCPNIEKGKGSFGKVVFSPKKIHIETKNGITTGNIISENNVVKKQPYNTRQVAVLREMNLLHQNRGAKIHALVASSRNPTPHATIISVMEDCGSSLDELNFNTIDFDKRISIAIQICCELIALKNNGIIHRDLKLGNICYKQLNDQHDLISLIDFGFAIEKVQLATIGKTVSGTPDYLSPEILENAEYSYASDLYALAPILGTLFGATHVFDNRNNLIPDFKEFKKLNSFIPFSFNDYRFDFSNLFSDIKKPPEIDEKVVGDIKLVLELMQNTDPDKRPSIEFVYKFFSCLKARKLFCNDMINELTPFVGEEKASFFASSLLKNESHSFIVNKMITNNDSISEYSSYISHKINTQIIQSDFTSLLEALNDPKFENTNSSGLIKIKKILSSNSISLHEKLTQISTIAKERITGLNNLYARSHLFGKGRHENIHMLYEKLATLDFEIASQELRIKAISKILGFIKVNDTFTYVRKNK